MYTHSNLLSSTRLLKIDPIFKKFTLKFSSCSEAGGFAPRSPISPTAEDCAPDLRFLD